MNQNNTKQQKIKSSRKSVMKGVQSLQKRISEHEAKILDVMNSDYSEDIKEEKIGHWRAEINAFKLNIEKLKSRKRKNKKK